MPRAHPPPNSLPASLIEGSLSPCSTQSHKGITKRFAPAPPHRGVPRPPVPAGGSRDEPCGRSAEAAHAAPTTGRNPSAAATRFQTQRKPRPANERAVLGRTNQSEERPEGGAGTAPRVTVACFPPGVRPRAGRSGRAVRARLRPGQTPRLDRCPRVPVSPRTAASAVAAPSLAASRARLDGTLSDLG